MKYILREHHEHQRKMSVGKHLDILNVNVFQKGFNVRIFKRKTIPHVRIHGEEQSFKQDLCETKQPMCN